MLVNSCYYESKKYLHGVASLCFGISLRCDFLRAKMLPRSTKGSVLVTARH